MPNPRPRVLVLAAVMFLAAACGESPTGVAPGDDLASLATQDVSTAVAGLDRSPDGSPASPLHRMLQHALHRIVAEQGREAAEAAVAPIRALHEEARAAHAAGDLATARAKALEAERHKARIVIEVFGPHSARRVMHAAQEGIRALHQRIRQGTAAGHDVAPLQRIATLAGAHLSRAQAAASGGDPAGALVWAARALGIVEHAMRSMHDGGVLQALLRQALAQVARTEGPQAARELAAGVDAARKAVEEAHSAGDREALRQAVHRFEYHVAGIIVSTLGPAPVRETLTRAAAMIDRMRNHADRAASQGRDVGPIAERLQAAQRFLRQAHAARDAGDAVGALVFGARAINILGGPPGR